MMSALFLGSLPVSPALSPLFLPLPLHSGQKKKKKKEWWVFCSSATWPVWKDTHIVATRLCKDILFLTFMSQTFTTKGREFDFIIHNRLKESLSKGPLLKAEGTITGYPCHQEQLGYRWHDRADRVSCSPCAGHQGRKACGLQITPTAAWYPPLYIH